MPYKPPDYHPEEPHIVIWDHLLDNSYSKKKYSRKKYVAQRRKQLARAKQAQHMATKIDATQIAMLVKEAKQQGLQNPES